MSRTDRTKPLWVRHAEHDPRPVHDHRHGVCDLPPSPALEAADTHCRWEDPAALLLFGAHCCAGCKIRSHIEERQRWARSAVRKERYAGRREARRAAMEENGDCPRPRRTGVPFRQTRAARPSVRPYPGGRAAPSAAG
ncbi:hypothetical protein ACIQ7D_21700 [Streptomyces sp. NPDC096310]|uniref:hypothetical protein n=1 Tax=Streptomyces sp. NPDC096310 TaxID=3366082 RepID=UPI0038008B46